MESWTLKPEIKKRMWLYERGNENSEAEAPLLMRDTDWRAEMRPVTRREKKHTHTHTHTGQNILLMHRFINACKNIHKFLLYKAKMRILSVK